jgi:hypothetical protein
VPFGSDEAAGMARSAHVGLIRHRRDVAAQKRFILLIFFLQAIDLKESCCAVHL